MTHLKIILLPIIMMPLFACGGNPQIHDSDYDGLIDQIDPDPNNNEYKAKFKRLDDPDTSFTNDYSFKVDYRDFIYNDVPSFNINTAKIAAMLSLDAFGKYEHTYIQNNVYFNEETKIFNLYPQFGIENVKYVVPTVTDNIYDVAGLFLGNHKFYFDNEQYQIFFATVNGYKDITGWCSSFDIGADMEEFEEMSDSLALWNDRKTHKGFYVTAERLFPLLNDYLTTYQDTNFKQYLFVCGQSRSAAIANLLAKKATDFLPETKTTGYAFNCPRVTMESNQEILRGYKNLFYVNCDEDFVSELPLPSWGYYSYGLPYHFSHEQNLDGYKNFMKRDYDGIPTKARDMMLDYFKNLAPTREDIYRFRPIDTDNNLELLTGYKSEIEAYAEAELIKNSISGKMGEHCVDAEVLFDEDTSTYSIQIYTKPAIIIAIVRRIFNIVKNYTGDIPVLEIISLLSEYYSVLPRYISELTELMVDLTLEGFHFSQVPNTHGPLATIASLMTAKPLE